MEPSRCTSAVVCVSRNSIERGCRLSRRSPQRSRLTSARGARTTRAPCGLRMSRPEKRRLRAFSRSSSRLLPRMPMLQPGPIRSATAAATRRDRPSICSGPFDRRRATRPIPPPRSSTSGEGAHEAEAPHAPRPPPGPACRRCLVRHRDLCSGGSARGALGRRGRWIEARPRFTAAATPGLARTCAAQPRDAGHAIGCTSSIGRKEGTMPLSEGDPAPDFDLPASGGGRIALSALKGHKVVLYFYPKDDTSGCTLEAQDFNAPAAGLRGGRRRGGRPLAGPGEEPRQVLRRSTGWPSRSPPTRTRACSKPTASGSRRACTGASTWASSAPPCWSTARARIARIWPKVKVAGPRRGRAGGRPRPPLTGRGSVSTRLATDP